MPDPGVATKARSRTYSTAYEARILEEHEALDRAGKGAVLRRKGLYTSLIWRGVSSGTRVRWSRWPVRPVGAGGHPRSEEHEATQGEGTVTRRAGQGSAGDRGARKALRAVGSALDRQPEQRERAHIMTDEAIAELAPVLGSTPTACAALSRPRANHYR